jgi:hypothetical protein
LLGIVQKKSDLNQTADRNSILGTNFELYARNGKITDCHQPSDTRLSLQKFYERSRQLYLLTVLPALVQQFCEDMTASASDLQFYDSMQIYVFR